MPFSEKLSKESELAPVAVLLRIYNTWQTRTQTQEEIRLCLTLQCRGQCKKALSVTFPLLPCCFNRFHTYFSSSLHSVSMDKQKSSISDTRHLLGLGARSVLLLGQIIGQRAPQKMLSSTSVLVPPHLCFLHHELRCIYDFNYDWTWNICIFFLFKTMLKRTRFYKRWINTYTGYISIDAFLDSALSFKSPCCLVNLQGLSFHTLTFTLLHFSVHLYFSH